MFIDLLTYLLVRDNRSNCIDLSRQTNIQSMITDRIVTKQHIITFTTFVKDHLSLNQPTFLLPNRIRLSSSVTVRSCAAVILIIFGLATYATQLIGVSVILSPIHYRHYHHGCY